MYIPFENNEEFDVFYDIDKAVNSRFQNILLNIYVDAEIQQLSDRKFLGVHIYADSEMELTEAFKTLAKLPNIKLLEIDTDFRIDGEALAQIKSLEHLIFYGNPLSKQFVVSLKDLPIRSLTIYKVSDLPSNLSALAHLQELNLVSATPISTMPHIASIPNLQKVQLSLSYELPEDIHLLKGLKEIHVDFISDDQNLVMPSSMIAFEQTTFRPPLVFDKLNLYIQNFGTNADLTEDQKKLAFAIITDQRQLLEEVLPNPFGEDFDPSQCVFFLAGRTEGMTQKELKEKLKEQGIKVATKLHNKVTHVLIGRLVKNALINAIIQRPALRLTLEDHLKDFLITQERPFLLDEDADPLNENVMEMLFNIDNTNVQVALTMLEDGGANTKIITVVMLLSLYHGDKDVRKNARKVYKKYASATLQNHVKLNKPYEFKPLYEYKTIYQHPEIDREIFMVMHSKLWNVSYLHIPSDWGMKCLPPETQYLKSLYSVNISEASHDFDFETSLNLLQHNNLERLKINKCNLKTIPPQIFDLFPNIEYLELEGNDLIEIPIEILKLTNLSSLNLCNNPIESLPEFLTQLKELLRITINPEIQIPKALEDYVLIKK